MDAWWIVGVIVLVMWSVATLNFSVFLLAPADHRMPIAPDRLHDFLAASGFCMLNLWNIGYLLNRKLSNIVIPGL